MPIFSIVVPTYNHGNIIQRCIDSVISQTFDDWEMIIINNFSSDDTIEKVESYNDSRIQLINFRNNGIIAASRNEGVRKAKGEWICFLDSDDWWVPEKLEESKKKLKNSDLIYHSEWIVVDIKQKKFDKIKVRDLKKPIINDLMINGNCISNSTVVVRKSILEKINLLDESKDIIGNEDFDTWIRVSKISERLSCIQKQLGYYWVGGGNVSSRDMSFSFRTVCERYYDLLSLDEIKIVKAKIAYHAAKYKMANDNKKEAQKILQKHNKTNLKFACLWFISLLPIFFWKTVHKVTGRFFY